MGSSPASRRLKVLARGDGVALRGLQLAPSVTFLFSALSFFVLIFGKHRFSRGESSGGIQAVSSTLPTVPQAEPPSESLVDSTCQPPEFGVA
jgi:hypothetical protein